MRSLRSLKSLRCLSQNRRMTTSLYMWGTDTSGSLLKNTHDSDAKKLDIPTCVESLNSRLGLGDDSTVLESVVCGPSATAWLVDGRVFVAGENKLGQLGVGHKNAVVQPTEVKLPSESPSAKITQVSLGSSFSAFIDSDGDLYTCGFGGSTFSGLGALGHGNSESFEEPKLVESLVEDGCRAKKVQVGESHMTVLTDEGEVLTTGAGSYGRLGNFDTVDQLYLEPVEVLTSGVSEIAGGKSFTLALRDGVVYGFGRNHKGQLGTGLGLAVDMYAMQAVPEPIESDELAQRTVTKVAAGHSHAACLTESGEVFFWGSSLHLEPIRLEALLHTKVVDLACGEDYSIALSEDGKLYCFGKGKTGVLGQGSATQLNQATLMEALEDTKVSAVSAGWKHAACLVTSSSMDQRP